jgi:hypothetical protein
MPGSLVSTRSSRRGFGGAVGHDHLPRVQAVADADAAAVVEADPARAAGDVEHALSSGQSRPRRCRPSCPRSRGWARPRCRSRGGRGRSRWAPSRGRCTASLNARPALRARRSPASRCARAGPGTGCARPPCGSSARWRVVGEELQQDAVGDRDVLGVARERRPAERPLALAEQRPDVLGHEALEVEGVGQARLERVAAQVVAVVEGVRAARCSSIICRARAPSWCGRTRPGSARDRCWRSSSASASVMPSGT